MFEKIFLYNLVIFFGIFTTLVYGQGYQVRTEVVCETNNVKLQCGGGEVLNIISVFFGRANGVTCPTGDLSNQSCNDPGAKHVLSTVCNNKPSCIAYANIEVLGDPCSGISKYLEIQYACVKSDIQSVTVCDGKPLELSCPYGQIIKIVNANFGRLDQVTCPNPAVSNYYCTATGSKDVMSNLCDNKQVCTPAYNFQFGDPCYGTYKYIDVQYRCVTRGAPAPLPTCSCYYCPPTTSWEYGK